MLVDGTYIPNVDTDAFRADVTGEVAGTGYTAGGIALTGVAVTYDAANNRATLDAVDADFGTLTVAGIEGVVIYADSGAAATDRLIGHHSLPPASPDGVNFTVEWAAAGIGTFTIAGA